MIEITIIALSLRTIRELREERGMTQQEVASGAGVSRNSVIRIENSNGPYGINYEVADRLAKFFGLPMDEVAWPFAISDVGRPGGTGTTCKKARITNDTTCPTCHYAMPATGICGNCE